MTMSDTGAHILVYPYPTLGHIIPFLDLTQQLLTRGLTVTALVTPNNLHLLQPLLSSSSSIQSLLLPDPEPLTKPGLFAILHHLRQLHYPLLLQWFQSQPSPPVAIISDFFLGWTQNLASELGVKRLVFSPSSSFTLALHFSMCQDPPRIQDPDDVNHTVSFPRIPYSPTYHTHQIVPIYRYGKDGDPGKEGFRKNWLANLESWGVVINTFAAMESIYIDHIKKEMGHDRVWAVGPVMMPDGGSDGAAAVDLGNRGGSSSVPFQNLMAWLDARKDHSVVYVCFGSDVVLRRAQMDAVAAGLEQSGVDFVWCVRERGHNSRPAPVDPGVIPDGFEERVAGKGLIIKGWAPQVAILRHRTVGVFLTHCGWNSSLEGIATGMVMLTWPMGLDQFTNTKLLVDQCGIGIRVGDSTQIIPEANKLARVLVESLAENREERIRAKRLQDAALDAVKGGSSHKDLDELVKAVNELNSKKETM